MSSPTDPSLPPCPLPPPLPPADLATAPHPAVVPPPLPSRASAATEAGSPQRSKISAAFVGALVVTAAVTFLATSFLWVAGFLSWQWWQERQQVPFAISLTHPEEVAFGELVQMDVEIKNDRRQAQTLDSIDIYHSFLRGFEVVAVEPTVEHSRDIGNFRTFGIGREMQPEETLQVRFTLRARRAGTFIGEVDVCNPDQFYTTAVARLKVQRPPRNR